MNNLLNEEVLINAGIGETRVATLVDGRLDQLILERARATLQGRAGHSLLGNIYLGRVQRVLPGMQAAFVEIGLKRAGFLGAREARCLSELPSMQDETLPPISQCVTEGQALLVQVVKDPIRDKGARLSANVTLPGRLLVLVPNQDGVALSRRIEDDPERARLTQICEAMIARMKRINADTAGANSGNKPIRTGGYIVRTAAIGAHLNELELDAVRLNDLWRDIEKTRLQAQPATCVYYDIDPVKKAMRDCVGVNTKRILIDDAEAFAVARRYCDETMPEILPRLERFQGPGALFDLFGVEDDLRTALDPIVTLPSGGYVVIETTEALTAIDINSGSYTEATGLEQTSVRTNLEAAEVICRQLKLRGIGGVIVIDFIHMNDPQNIARVLEVLRSGLANDRTPTQISGMSEFGLVEMTRKRTREPLSRLLSEDCGVCGGVGRNRAVVAIGNEVLRCVEREGALKPGRQIRVSAAGDVTAWLTDGEEDLLGRLIRRLGVQVSIEARPGFPRERYEITVG
ncbi:MAG: Rne/Rng family ribonuclease [Pseudomonadota bacterium]